MVPMSYSCGTLRLSAPGLPVCSGVACLRAGAKTCTTRRSMETRMERWLLTCVATITGGVG